MRVFRFLVKGFFDQDHDYFLSIQLFYDSGGGYF